MSYITYSEVNILNYLDMGVVRELLPKIVFSVVCELLPEINVSVGYVLPIVLWCKINLINISPRTV